MPLLEKLFNLAQLSLKAMWQPVTFGVRTIIEDREGRIVLIRDSYASGWFFPGGGVDRHELPEVAAVREAREEAGLISSAPPEFFGLYVQKVGWVSNVVAVYRLRDAEIEFRKSFEVRECQWADPKAPPPGTTAGTLRRLAELAGRVPKRSRW
jgi:8-oxo-dGTP pyrophosphatase MutT (NUDIX family)